MEFGTLIGKTAVDLVKNENIQNKAANAMGMLFPYAGLTKKALEIYLNEIENSDKSPELKMFLIMNAKKKLRKIKNQKQICEIAIENAKEGTDFSKESGVQEEWLDRFMNSASFVSSEEVQLIWGKILANEFENPGSTPSNMIRVLSEITPNLANSFRKLCSMKVWIMPLTEDENIEGQLQRSFVPYNGNEDLFQKIEITFNILNELETLGVLKFESLNGYVNKGINNNKVLICVDDKLEVINKHNENEMPIGDVLFTSVGKALKRITSDEEIPSYYEMIKVYLTRKGVVFADKHNFYTSIVGDKIHINKN